MEYIDITNHTLNKIITNNQLRETLEIWINNDKQISEFKTNKNKFKLNNFIKITFNKNIKFENNYKFYFDISKEPKIDIIKNLDLIYNYYIKYINNYYENKKLKFNQKIIFNNIYEYMNKNNMELEYLEKIKKKKIKYANIKESLNNPEVEILEILKNIYSTINEIKLIIPQYTLPIKFKSKLICDFFVVLIIETEPYLLIIEHDGPHHYNNNYYLFSKKNILCDLIKNNFCIANKISLLRIKYDNINFKITIENFITKIITSKKEQYEIRDYEDYIKLINE